MNLDFDEARDDGVALASAGPYANHLQLTLARCQISSECVHCVTFQWPKTTIVGKI